MIGAAEHCGASAILLRPINDIRKLIVSSHMVDLCRRLVVPRAPGMAAIEADGRSLIGSENHAGRILRIDPKLVIVVSAGRAAHN